jgi:hypothetical protein
LHGHQADVVGDDVVQLSRDPGALLLRRQRDLPVALALGLLGPRFDLAQVGLVGAAEDAGHAGRDEHQRVHEEVVGLGVAGQGLRLDAAGQQNQAEHHALAVRAALHHRVVGNGRRERQRRVAEADLVVQHPRYAHGEEGHRRPGAAPGQRQRLQHDQCIGEIDRAQLPVLGDQ